MNESGGAVEVGWANESFPEGLKCADRTHVYYRAESVGILGFAALPVILFGLVANALSIRIFTHPVMRSSPINWYLAVLSTSDLFILLTSFLMLCLPRVGEFCRSWAAYRLSLYTSPFSYPIGTMAQTISVYATVLMSLHRFIGVCLPFRAGEILSRGRVKLALAGLFAFAFAINVSRFAEVYVVGECYDETIQDWAVLIDMTALRMNVVYQFVFFGLGQTILMFVIPFAALIVMNSKIIHAVHRTRKQHESMQNDESAKKAELAKEISTSVMLVGIVVVFLLCNSLGFGVNVLEVSGVDIYHSAKLSTMVDLSNLLVTVNASINICVYLLFSEKYRALLKYYAGCLWLREGELLLSAFQ